ncbi:tautomerase family protein [Sphaerisporangium fuscum]|uniref:tautomerase family protein n=1 Tax=Sphaerisporangium fuscum TaxID=2835868 RepID=UPI001BDCA05F|nr:tautomerase family protein [Sphaerisporangium fuscum]
MPLVRIDALRADRERLEALGRAVQDALAETIGVPPDDVFQVLTGHDGARSVIRYDHYLGIQRDDDVVFVGITMRSGRAPDRKRALYRRIAELVQGYAGTDPRNVVITITENEPVDWSFGHGIAQYAEASPGTAESHGVTRR